MSRRFLTFGTVLLVAIAWAGFGFAQESKFAFFDMQKFMGTSARAKEHQKKLTDLVNVHRTKLESLKKDLMNLNEEVQKQGPMLKEEKRNQMIVEMEKKKVEYQLAEKEAQNAVQAAEHQLMETLQKEITAKIAKIRAERNLSFVFNSVALVSADDALDVTEEVVKSYDAEGGQPAPVRPKPTAAPKPKPKP